FPAGKIAIVHRGADEITNDDGKQVTLERYSIAGLGWGRETVWLDAEGNIAAWKGNDAEVDPVEITRTGVTLAVPSLAKIATARGVAQLRESASAHEVSTGGVVAYVGPKLVDGRGGPPIEDAAVIVDGEKIVAAGARSKVAVPRGARVVDVK